MITPDPNEIEVGAIEGDLRYWRAQEAVRQGEARLKAQATIRAALEARATALTGWAAVSLLAATGAGFTVKDQAGQVGALGAGLLLFAASAVGIHAVRPRAWSMVGYDPLVILNDPLPSELELLESIGEGLSKGIQANNIRLNSIGRSLRLAGTLLITAPLLGMIGYREAVRIISSLEQLLLLFRWVPA